MESQLCRRGRQEQREEQREEAYRSEVQAQAQPLPPPNLRNSRWDESRDLPKQAQPHQRPGIPDSRDHRDPRQHQRDHRNQREEQVPRGPRNTRHVYDTFVHDTFSTPLRTMPGASSASSSSRSETYTSSERRVVGLAQNPPPGGFTKDQEEAMLQLVERRDRRKKEEAARQKERRAGMHGGEGGRRTAVAAVDNMSQYSQLPSEKHRLPSPVLRAKARETHADHEAWQDDPSLTDVETERASLMAKLEDDRRYLKDLLIEQADTERSISETSIRLAYLSAVGQRKMHEARWGRDTEDAKDAKGPR